MSLYVVMRSGLETGAAAVRESSADVTPVVEADTCESLFWALDGRDLVVLGKRWRVEVFSVVQLAGRRYMQLSLEGPAQYMLTLRLAVGTSVRSLVPAVLSWLAHPTCSGEVIDVV